MGSAFAGGYEGEHWATLVVVVVAGLAVGFCGCSLPYTYPPQSGWRSPRFSGILCGRGSVRPEISGSRSPGPGRQIPEGAADEQLEAGAMRAGGAYQFERGSPAVVTVPSTLVASVESTVPTRSGLEP